MKKILRIATIITLLLMLAATDLGAAEETIPWPPKIQDIETMTGWMHDLVDRYPHLLELSVIGRSTDNRPVYALEFTDEAIPSESPDGTDLKKRFLLETGTHAREVANPFYVLKMVELYAMDYEEDAVVPEYNLKELLGKAVIHVLPMTNPDGYAYAVSGKASIRSEALRDNMAGIYEPVSHEWYKANLNGVDLNRNFPAEYYDPAGGTWKDLFGMDYGSKSYAPAYKFYSGESAASEIETRVVMEYMDAYSFRALVNYHSKGRLIFWNRWMLPDAFNDHVEGIARAMAREAHYDMRSGEYQGSGFMTDYFAINKMKPAFTVETGTFYFDQDLREEFRRVKLLPLIAFTRELEAPYGRYRLYVDGRFMNDFTDPVYARAFAEKLGGQVLEGEGAPQEDLLRFREAIEALEEAGILQGAPEGMLADKAMTKAQAMVLLARTVPLLAESPYIHDPAIILNWRLVYKPLPLFDVPEWAREAVAAAYMASIVEEEEGGSFGPKLAVPLNRFLSWLFRTLGYVEGEDFTLEEAGAFAVGLGLATWEELSALNEKGLLREEAAFLVHRLITRRYLG